jgi:hypothetical protein
MDPDTLVPSGTLATALTLAAVSGESLAAARPAPQNPAEVLASLMDFPGSVALAELLQTSPARGDAGRARRDPAVGERGQQLLRATQLRLDAAESQILKPLLGSRSPELPAPHELLQILQRHGVDTDRGEKAAQRLADELGEPFRSAFGLSLRQAQAHITTLRWELTHELRALGPRADQLERLDATLSRSMQAKVGELLDRMEHAADLTFTRACAHALASLPAELCEADLAAWCAADGWLERYRERCVRMAKALFGHLRRSLEGLLRAATLSEDP